MRRLQPLWLAVFAVIAAIVVASVCAPVHAQAAGSSGSGSGSDAGSGAGVVAASATSQPGPTTSEASSASGSGIASDTGSSGSGGGSGGSGGGSGGGSDASPPPAQPVTPVTPATVHPVTKEGYVEDMLVDDPEAPRWPMTGDGMKAILAKPWPKDVTIGGLGDQSVCKGKEKRSIVEAELAKRRICLVTISYKTPKSLENSVKSWKRSGLLDFVDDKIMWLNAATDPERELGKSYGFRVMEPRMLVKHVIKTDFPQMFKGKKPQKIPVVIRGTEKNSWTVAPSFVHAADMTDADYVLFLEKDFEIPESYDREHVRAELLNAVLHMERGIKLFRLRSRKDLGTEGLPNCCGARACPGRWVGGNTWTRQRNWFNYFCDPLPGAAVSKKLVAQCDARKTRCFTSYDSNWSNNPFLINRQYIFNGEKGGNIAKVALWSSSQRKNGKFEVNELNNDWGKHRTPICQSWQGLFVHHEIDGRRRLRGSASNTTLDLEEHWGAHVESWTNPDVMAQQTALHMSELVL